jgi:hypothetical protein
MSRGFSLTGRGLGPAPPAREVAMAVTLWNLLPPADEVTKRLERSEGGSTLNR